MLKNYFKTAFRNLLKQRLYSTINVLGLAFGLACFLLMALYVQDEWSFDAFHKKADRLYRITELQPKEAGGEQRLAAVSFKLGEEAEARLPEVEDAVKMTIMGRFVLRNEANEREFYEEFITAEPALLEMLDFPLAQGDSATALTEPNSLLLSQEMAEKLFDTEDPMGKTVQTDRGLALQVSGVMAPIPGNSHLQFKALVSHSTLKAQDWYERVAGTDWTSNFWPTYLLLDEQADPQAVASKMTAMVKNHATEEDDFKSTFQLQPLRDIHFGSNDIEGDFHFGKSRRAYLHIFSITGIFILLLACINYMNLATARSGNYAREVGIRKVAGATRWGLASRFLMESALISSSAFVMAYALAYMALPYLNNFTEKALTVNLQENHWILPFGIGIIILVSLLSGSYPAFFLSRYRPANVLKGQRSKAPAHLAIRKTLVTFQFVISAVMIVGTLVAWHQMQYIQGKDLGFQQEQMIVMDINSGKVRSGYETIRAQYRQLPEVQSVSVSSRVPGEWKAIPQVGMRPQGQASAELRKAYFIGGDEYFLETFDIPLLAGRNFDTERPMDSTSIIINESAAALLGIEKPEEQEFIIPNYYFNGVEGSLQEPQRARVIGIVPDFHFQSLHEEIQPLVIGAWNNNIHSIDYFTAKVDVQDTEALIARLTDILHQIDPGQIFEYHFLDEQIAGFYRADQRRSQIFSVAALCAIFIACLGLFGLAAFTVRQRSREISIRKVLGATVSNIVTLLSKDFLSLVLIALLIALPISWYIMSRWLHNFAYSISIQWWIFALAGFIAVAIALLSVGYQSVRAALANPVEALRSE